MCLAPTGNACRSLLLRKAIGEGPCDPLVVGFSEGRLQHVVYHKAGMRVKDGIWRRGKGEDLKLAYLLPS